MSDNNETQPEPLMQNVDISEKEDDSDDLFSSAIDDISSENQNTQSLDNNIWPAFLPKLQLSMQDKGPPPVTTPLEENEPENPGLHSPPPVHKKQLTAEEIEKEGGDQFLQIAVTETIRVGDGMGTYVAYKVETQTNIPVFRKKKFTVQRRFSDFLGLHEKLVEKYLRAGRIIPPAPEKSVIGMTKIKMSAQNEQGSSSEFVEKRRASLERYLTRTAAHPVLKMDPDFREFLEADIELPKATNTSALSSAGVMRLFNKFGETVNKITYKMDENDPWFEEKTQQIDNLDMQLRKLHLSVEALVIGRKDLVNLTASFAKSAAMLSNCEEHTSLSRALSQLAEVEEKVESLHNEQANTDFSILCELLKDYVALLGAIKEVFHERVKVYQNWQHAQLVLNKKREYKAKLDLSNRTDKGNSASTEIADWEAKVVRCQEEFNSISKMIKKEMDQFEVTRVKEFKSVIFTYLEKQVTHQQQLIKYWEQFLPEAKVIA
ncbi:sorting nexin 1 [Lycorma delicatula]|uniref:sorting nexin 1 n=1 Tax=Lycorma delicatula TaxID=130591 RepID=UPI003F50EF3F